MLLRPGRGGPWPLLTWQEFLTRGVGGHGTLSSVITVIVLIIWERKESKRTIGTIAQGFVPMVTMRPMAGPHEIPWDVASLAQGRCDSFFSYPPVPRDGVA